MTIRTISRNDYNSIRSQLALLLGNGSASRGYGQAVYSTELPAPPTPVTIQDEQWDSLYYDLINILIHQTGVTPSLPNVGEGEVIRLGASYPLSSYESAIAQADINRFNLALNQSVITSQGTVTYSSPWSNQATASVIVQFSNPDQARYFFNSGGKIRFSSSRTGGSSTAQNNSWTSLLLSAGVLEFGAASENLNFYTLTGDWQTLTVRSGSGYYLYAANSLRIEARCNIPDNSNGGAQVVFFRISWSDAYVDLKPSLPLDQVDGLLTLTVEEQKASGVLQPSGNFSITSPSYVISSISAL